MKKDSEIERLEALIDIKKEDKNSRTSDFLESLHQSVLRYGTLTEKQANALEKIEELSTPAAKERAAKWIVEYPQQFRKDAVICAKYYLANPPYFSELAKEIMNKKSFVPTQPQFDHLCGNPYAQRVLSEYHRPPVFEKGALVQFRSSKTIPFHLSMIKDKICVVIDNKCDFITTHAIGAKTYKLLPIGRTTTLLCQERWIKNFRNKK